MITPTERLLNDLLDQLELFQGLQHEERAFLSRRMQPCTFERGEALVTQGEKIDKVFLVASGLVAVVREGEAGQMTEVAQLGQGALVGELSLLTAETPNATVRAILPVEAWVLEHEALDTLLHRSPTLARSFNRILGRKLSATNRRLQPQRTVRLAALLGNRRHPFHRTLSLELAASVARHTRERVLLVDCLPRALSAIPPEALWGASVEQLLREPALLNAHERPPEPDAPYNGARVIRFSDDPGNEPDPAALLSLAARLRSLYGHILFDLPADAPRLLEDTLPLVHDTVLLLPRVTMGGASTLLERPEVAAARAHGMLAITGWPHRFTMGEVWKIEEELGWSVATLLCEGERQQGIDRLARRVARKRVGIAWGGGTARGWALAGIAEALESLQVPMDLFAGTSAGALGAAVYGLSLRYQEADRRMRAVLPYLRRTTRFMLPLAVSRHALFGEKWWNSLIQTFVEEKGFDDMKLPYAAVALDLATGEQHIFTRGLLWHAIRASSAVPMLAPAMMVEGRPYADGGVVNAIPLDVVQQMGADILIGIDLTGAEKEAEWGKGARPHMFGTLFRTINVAYNTAASRTIPLADVLIRPQLRAAAVYDVSVMDEFIEEGRRATLAALPELREVMPWL